MLCRLFLLEGLAHKLHKKLSMKNLANIIIILMVVTASHPGYAQDENQEVTLSKDQSFALNLVNQIRQDPLFYAAKYFEYDRETLIQELPWLADILDKGLPLPIFSPNVKLNVLAEQKNLLSHQELDQEAKAEGDKEPLKIPLKSDFILKGEIGGVVSFYSFMPAKFAWEIVIINQFKQELKPDMEGPLYILNPRFDTMGLDMRGGPNEVDGELVNAYFATICFVSSRLKAEAQVLNMVNQVRYNPSSINTYMESSLIEILDHDFFYFAKWLWLYPYSPEWNSSNLPPLFDNSNLHDSARYRASGLLNPDDPSLKQDMMGATLPETELYKVKKESVAKVIIPVDVNSDITLGLTSDEVAYKLFTSMLGAELRAVYKKGAIFSVETDRGGVGIDLASINDREQSVIAVLHAARVAQSSADETSPADFDTLNRVGIYGVVFSDTDENQIYSPGEGKESIPVDVFRTSDNSLVGRTFTDASGHFSVTLEKDQEYRFEISSGENRVLFSKAFDKSSFLPVDLSRNYP